MRQCRRDALAEPPGSDHGSLNLRALRRRRASRSVAGRRKEGRREAVQVDCGRGRRGDAYRRVERVERLWRAERAAQGSPIKLGVLTPLSGELCALGHPGTRGGVARRERDQQVGRREGARAGPAAQPRRRRRPIHQHHRGRRRLQAVDSAGERRLGRGHHRQPHRAGDDAARRGRKDSAVPGEVGEQRDPDAVEPLHVPHLPARRCHGRPVGRAVRAAT